MTTIMQALRFKTGRDFVLINLLYALLILVIVLFPHSPVRIILGLPFVLFFTGYVSISALFPGKEELDIIERLAFSTALSMAIASLIGLILNYTPFGIRVYSVAFSLFSFIVLVSTVALYRRRTISPSNVSAQLTPDRDKGRFDVITKKGVRHGTKSEPEFMRFFSKAKLEYIILPVFIAIALFLYHQKYFSYIFMVIAAVIGVLLFIVLNKYSTKDEVVILGLPEDKSHTLQLVTSSLFFIFYGLSFLTLLQGFYTKTVWYYIFVSLCVGFIAIEILFVKTKTQGTLNLIKSFLLVLNITLSNQILYSYGIALPDFVGHFKGVLDIINNGCVPVNMWGNYELFPCHHILVAASSLIAGSDPKMTYLYLGGFVICVGLLFVFLIGREFVNLQFGLFAALIYANLDYLIMYGAHPTHQAYNYFLSIVLFAVILYVYKRRDPRFITLYPLLVITMVFTHHYCAIIIFIVLSSLIIAEIFQYIKERDYKFRLLGLVQIYVVILFAQWMFYSHMMGSFVAIIEAYKSAFAKGAESLVETTAYDLLPIRTLFLNTIGSSILIVLSVIGFLYFFNKRSFFKNSIIIITINLSILLGIGIVLKHYALLPDRMYPFLQLFGLVFLASAGVVWILNRIKLDQNRLKVIPVILLIMCLAFFSLSSTIAGFETSLFVDEHTAYYKLYGSPHESYFSQWDASYIANKHLFSMDMGLEEDLDKRRYGITEKLKEEFECKGFALPVKSYVRKGEDYQWSIIDEEKNKPWYFVREEEGKLNVYDNYSILNKLPVTKDGIVDIQNITENSFIIFNKFYLKTGLWIQHIEEAHLGGGRFIRIKEDKLYVLERYDKYYDNGMVNLYIKINLEDYYV